MTYMIGPDEPPYNHPDNYGTHARKPHKKSTGCAVAPPCTPLATDPFLAPPPKYHYHANDKMCPLGGKAGGCEQLHWSEPVGYQGLGEVDRSDIRRKLNESNLKRKARKIVVEAEPAPPVEPTPNPPIHINRRDSSYEAPPDHYATGRGIQPWDVWDAFDLDRYTANATKYLLRAGKKPGEGRLKDLKKALNYVHKAIERAEEDERRRDQ